MKKLEEAEVKYLSKNGANVFKHTINTIKSLSKSYNLFIVSNCQIGYINSFIDYYHLNNYFIDFECNGNTGLQKVNNIKLIMDRNQLNNDDTCYVGDTSSDYDDSSNNKLIFVWAKYGFGKNLDSKYSIDDISKLPEVINSIN